MGKALSLCVRHVIVRQESLLEINWRVKLEPMNPAPPVTAPFVMPAILRGVLVYFWTGFQGNQPLNMFWPLIYLVQVLRSVRPSENPRSDSEPAR